MHGGNWRLFLCVGEGVFSVGKALLSSLLIVQISLKKEWLYGCLIIVKQYAKFIGCLHLNLWYQEYLAYWFINVLPCH